MSESRLPPPLPPQFVQPIPVQPLAELAHEDQFQPDVYGNFRHRPGIITAISILSITIGSLGMITGGLSALYGGVFFLIAKQTVAMQRTAAIASAHRVPAPTLTNDASLDPNAPPTVEERGLDQPTREAIIDVLAAHRPLNDSRRRELHALLAKAGQDVFINSGGGVISADIQRAISESGQLPSASDADGSNGPDYFVIATGRIEVSDDRAVFEPSDHSQDTVRVRAPKPSTDAFPTAKLMRVQDANLAVEMVNKQTGNRLTNHQRQTLIKEFLSSSGLLVASSGGMPVSSQLLSSTLQPDNSVLVQTTQGQIQVDPMGMVQSQAIYGATTTNGGVTTFSYHSSATNTNPFAGANGRPTVSSAAVTVVVSEGILSVLLSIYLLIIGIFTLRQSPRGRRFHVIYALVKIPLATICGIGWCWIIGGFYSSIHTAGGGSSIVSVRAVVLAMATVVAILYPIGLLITFATPPAKQYYDTASTGP